MLPPTDAFHTLNGQRLQMPLCDSPFFDEIVTAGPYSDAERALLKAFRSDGYVVFDLAIPDFAELADALIDDLATSAREAGEEQPVRVQDAWAKNDRVKALACLPQILNTIQLLYGARPFPFQTLNFRFGSQQMTHSDSVHFSTIPARMMCGVWVALEDVDAGNGPLHYYPGSHKLPIYDFEAMGIGVSDKPKGYELYGSVYEPFVQRLVAATGLEKKTLHVRQGQALIWAANLLHGGEAIAQPGRTRHSQVTHYYFDDCLYYTPLWSDLGLKAIDYRTPYDILAGAPHQPRFDGRIVKVAEDPPPPSLAARGIDLARRVKRRLRRALRG